MQELCAAISASVMAIISYRKINGSQGRLSQDQRIEQPSQDSERYERLFFNEF